MQNGRSWVKKRNLGQKNETLARKTGFPALLLSVSIERGAESGKISSGWQIILLRHTGDFQKTGLLGTVVLVFTQVWGYAKVWVLGRFWLRLGPRFGGAADPGFTPRSRGFGANPENFSPWAIFLKI